MPYALDPELAAAVAAMPPAMDLSDIPALRALLTAMTPPGDPKLQPETIRIPREDGSLLDVVLFSPGDTDTTLLWFHAGGQILGTGHDDADYHADLALALDCTVAVVDYRLAPETQAPGAAEDGYLAYTHLAADGRRIGIAGASGGGAVAAATALMIRDRQGPKPCLLALSYPMLDDRNETPSSHEITDLGIWDRGQNLLAWAAVLGDRVQDPGLHPYAAPGRATDLSGLPDTFVAAAQFDVFRDEDIDFARRLIAAGVPVDLHVYAGAFHAWDRFAPGSALARTFERTWHDYLRRHLHS